MDAHCHEQWRLHLDPVCARHLTSNAIEKSNGVMASGPCSVLAATLGAATCAEAVVIRRPRAQQKGRRLPSDLLLAGSVQTLMVGKPRATQLACASVRRGPALRGDAWTGWPGSPGRGRGPLSESQPASGRRRRQPAAATRCKKSPAKTRQNFRRALRFVWLFLY